MNPEKDVIFAVLKLSRAMRRCPPPHAPTKRPFSPALARLLACVAENRDVSSRDLCEMMDIRPSSLSEILARAEEEGWISRTVDERDRRVQRVRLSPAGESLYMQMKETRRADLERKTACFTDEEKAQFCALCNKLSEHLESLASDVPDEMKGPFRQDMPDPDGPDPAGSEFHEKPHRRLPPGGRMRC